MTLVRRKKSHSAVPATFGIRPTKQEKLQHVTGNLGLPGMGKMQGSSVNIFDTILLASNATGRTTLQFFANATNKSRNFSNFQSSVLNAGESMIMEDISMQLLVLSAADLTQDSTNITDIIPISGIDVSLISNKSAPFHGALMDIIIANQKVVKDYQMMETNPNYNPKTTGVGAAQGAITGPAVVALDSLFGQNQIKLMSPPVLPPNQKLIVSVELPPLGTVTGNIALQLTIGKFGSIFNGKTNL